LINTARKLTGTLLMLSLAAIFATPAQAEPEAEVLSQLPGHDIYRDDPQMDATDYYIGRVRGIAGSILFIELEKPVTIEGTEYNHLHMAATGWGKYQNIGYPRPGDDLALKWENGGWVIVDRYNPYWVTRLQLRDVTEVQRSAINWGESRQVGLPALQPSQAVVREMEPVPQPIRGMW
jgi:hypothetical protein